MDKEFKYDTQTLSSIAKARRVQGAGFRVN